MPRIRSIKPEMPNDEGLAARSIPARLLFVYLITQADDEGRMRGATPFVRSRCLPYDDVTLAEVDDWIAELEEGGFVTRYLAGGETYLAINRWGDHQRPSNFRASEIPAITRDHVRPAPAPRPLRARSAPAPRADRAPIGEGEGEGEEEGENRVVALDARRRPEVEKVFARWIESTGRDRVKLDEKRRRLIRKALADYPLEDVLAAVDGWRHSPHHRGENPNGTVYNDLSLILRNGENVERFRDYALGKLEGRGDRGPTGEEREAEMLRGIERIQKGRSANGAGSVGPGVPTDRAALAAPEAERGDD